MGNLRQAIGQEIVDTIKARTQSGKGLLVNEKGEGTKVAWDPYTKEYRKSIAFKAAGKSNRVNLTLSEDMLGSMDIISETSETITIGFDDDLERKKAYAHQKGREGDSKVNVPARPFFGISNAELERIKKEFKNDVAELKETRKEKGNKAFQSLLAKTLKRLEE